MTDHDTYRLMEQLIPVRQLLPEGVRPTDLLRVLERRQKRSRREVLDPTAFEGWERGEDGCWVLRHTGFHPALPLLLLLQTITPRTRGIAVVPRGTRMEDYR